MNSLPNWKGISLYMDIRFVTSKKPKAKEDLVNLKFDALRSPGF
ncbi:MAG: hypothetical protein ABJ333_17655 [Algoriphagus sp.]